MAEGLVECRGISSLSVHQLTPELAKNLAAVDEVVFVDAEFNDRHNRIQIHSLPPGSHKATSSHGCSPESLLDLCEHLYGHRPIATLIGIPARDNSLGEHVSAVTQAGIEEARTWILQRRSRHA